MEAAIKGHVFPAGLSPQEVISLFFRENSVESVRNLFWHLFQCWIVKDCNLKEHYTDENIALFLDQLTSD